MSAPIVTNIRSRGFTRPEIFQHVTLRVGEGHIGRPSDYLVKNFSRLLPDEYVGADATGIKLTQGAFFSIRQREMEIARTEGKPSLLHPIRRIQAHFQRVRRAKLELAMNVETQSVEIEMARAQTMLSSLLNNRFRRFAPILTLVGGAAAFFGTIALMNLAPTLMLTHMNTILTAGFVGAILMAGTVLWKIGSWVLRFLSAGPRVGETSARAILRRIPIVRRFVNQNTSYPETVAGAKKYYTDLNIFPRFRIEREKVRLNRLAWENAQRLASLVPGFLIKGIIDKAIKVIEKGIEARVAISSATEKSLE